jgi:hypothetical protein
VQVEGAEFINGMLIIALSTVTPESNKKKINIKEPARRQTAKNSVYVGRTSILSLTRMLIFVILLI